MSQHFQTVHAFAAPTLTIEVDGDYDDEGWRSAVIKLGDVVIFTTHVPSWNTSEDVVELVLERFADKLMGVLSS